MNATPVPAFILDALPQPCAGIVETHASWVLLAGDFAYKVKKPVTLPFLDYGTLERRRFCCAEELRLNRRFAPDLYLDVVELAGEPAVRMRRFDESLRLDHVSSHGDLSGAHLVQFARDLVAFQRSTPPVETAHGSPQTIRADAQENFDELDRLLPMEAASLSRLRSWTETEWAARQNDFARRQATGHVREGHGDLHLGNLLLLDGRVVAFDGIEFNTGFRCIDVANEIAFTLLDLLDHCRPGLAHWLLDAWLIWSGDFDALKVLRFYLVYRGMVRAKVAALRGDAQEAAAYLAMATRLTRPPAPVLTLTCGPSGCGKTTAASRRLATADFLHTVRIRSDVERKRLCGLPPDADSGGTIYSADTTRRTYRRLAELAELAVTAGWSTIVDAAFLRRSERDDFRALAARLGLACDLLAPQATPAEMAQRIVHRRDDPSEATPAILQQQLDWFEPPAPDEFLPPGQGA